MVRLKIIIKKGSPVEAMVGVGKMHNMNNLTRSLHSYHMCFSQMN